MKKPCRKQGDPTPPELKAVRAGIAARLAAAVIVATGRVLGSDGIAEQLKIPGNNWRRYVAGGIMPDRVLLTAIAEYNIEPTWLQHGVGPMFRADISPRRRAAG